jgi:predicted amidophosphoribosyltransferase
MADTCCICLESGMSWCNTCKEGNLCQDCWGQLNEGTYEPMVCPVCRQTNWKRLFSAIFNNPEDYYEVFLDDVFNNPVQRLWLKNMEEGTDEIDEILIETYGYIQSKDMF